MSRTLRSATAALLLGTALISPATFAGSKTAAKPFTAKLMASLERVGDPQISPDGTSVLYDQRSIDYDSAKVSHGLWLVDLATHKTRKLAIGEATNGRWSPDGHIYFLAERDGVSQILRTTASGTTPEVVGALPLSVAAFRIAPDGKTFVVAVAEYPDCADMACTKARQEAAKTEKSTGVVYDRLFVRHWDTWADGTRNHLYAFTLDANGHATAPVALTRGFDGDVPNKPFGGDGDFAISPDGKTVVFSAKVAGKSESWTTNFDNWSVPIDGSAAPKNLTAANPAWDAAPVFSPDGRFSAYRAMRRPGFEADRFAILLRDETTGTTRELAPNWDRSAEALEFSADGKSLFVTAQDDGQNRLFVLDIATGTVKALTDEGTVNGFVARKNTIVFARNSLSGPDDLFALDRTSGKTTRLTDANAANLAGVHWGKAERFAFAGWNGETVKGYVVKPANFEKGHRYPVAFLIHGGPQGSFGNGWSYRWNPQAFAAAGYAVVMIDFHGSTGYGQAFTDAISQHWGDRPLEDLQKGWAYALDRFGFLDGNRACALGASYGGFMIDWIAGQWNGPWKCLVNHDGVFDTRGMGYATEELWFDEWERGGTFYDVPEAFERFNPAAHVKNWKKPMMVIHGGTDFRIPLAQGLGSFTALQRQGIESKFLFYPNENHWVLKAHNSVQWYGEVLGWLDRWTKE